MQEGDFTEQDREWIQAICRFLESEWKLKVNLSFTTNLKHHNSYGVTNEKCLINDMAGVYHETGYMWFNPKKHVKEPKVQLLNSIIHEALHVRFPKGAEKDINEIANELAPINEN